MQIISHDGFIAVRSASEVKDVVNGVIDLTLGVATQGCFDPSTPTQQVNTACMLNADFHDLEVCHGGIAILDEAKETRFRGAGRDADHIEHLHRLVHSAEGNLVLGDANLQMRLDHIGIRPLPGAAPQDRLLMHRATSEGQRRAAFFNVPHVAVSGDNLHFLLTHGGTLTAPLQPASGTVDATSCRRGAAGAAEPNIRQHEHSPNLGSLIDPIIDNLVRKDNWTIGVAEDARRLIRQFVWIVGDKPCLEYSQVEVAKFRDALWDMPKTTPLHRRRHMHLGRLPAWMRLRRLAMVAGT